MRLKSKKEKKKKETLKQHENKTFDRNRVTSALMRFIFWSNKSSELTTMRIYTKECELVPLVATKRVSC